MKSRQKLEHRDCKKTDNYIQKFSETLINVGGINVKHITFLYIFCTYYDIVNILLCPNQVQEKQVRYIVRVFYTLVYIYMYIPI